MALEALKSLLQISNVLRLLGSSRNELATMDKYIQELETKRKRALERAKKIDNYDAPVISDWEDDD